MSKKSEAVIRWRKNAKSRLIRAFGGQCGICGYKKCDEALEFHHLNPEEKETTWSSFRGSIKGWETILIEIRKCVLLCSNCHKEYHAGKIEIPENIPRLDEHIADYKTYEREQFYDNCLKCGKQKLKQNKTCSVKCAGSLAKKGRWDDVDLEELLIQHKTYSAVGRLFDVTGNAVKKRLMIIRRKN